MHVLQLGPYPPPEGGINRNILAIREELLNNGHQCSIIATSRSSKITPEPDVYHPRSPLELVKLLFTLNYDILHLHVGGAVTKRVLALIFACGFFSRGKNVFTLHSGGYPLSKEGKAAKKNSIRGFLFQRFRRLIGVNQLIAEVFERYGVEKNNIRIIYPFVHKLPDPNVQIPADLKIFADRHSPLLLTVGLLEPDYDLFMQIDAMESVLETLPNAGLMIVGSGSLDAKLREAIAAKPYSAHIFLTCDVEHKVTLHLINDCDMLLRTTLFDGDAISVREALFLDTPVIATDNGMRPESVRLIAFGDKAALVGAIKSVATLPHSEKRRQAEEPDNIIEVVRLYEALNKGA